MTIQLSRFAFVLPNELICIQFVVAEVRERRETFFTMNPSSKPSSRAKSCGSFIDGEEVERVKVS